jgi:hypothetical protein
MLIAASALLDWNWHFFSLHSSIRCDARPTNNPGMSPRPLPASIFPPPRLPPHTHPPRLPYLGTHQSSVAVTRTPPPHRRTTGQTATHTHTPDERLGLQTASASLVPSLRVARNTTATLAWRRSASSFRWPRSLPLARAHPQAAPPQRTSGYVRGIPRPHLRPRATRVRLVHSPVMLQRSSSMTCYPKERSSTRTTTHDAGGDDSSWCRNLSGLQPSNRRPSLDNNWVLRGAGDGHDEGRGLQGGPARNTLRLQSWWRGAAFFAGPMSSSPSPSPLPWRFDRTASSGTPSPMKDSRTVDGAGTLESQEASDVRFFFTLHV